MATATYYFWWTRVIILSGQSREVSCMYYENWANLTMCMKVWVISHSQHSAMIRCPSKASEFKCCIHNKIHCTSCKEQQPLRLQELGPPQEVQFRACWKLSTAAFPSQTAQGLLAVTFLASLQEDWQVLEKNQTLHSKHQLISDWLYKQKQNITLWFIIITVLLTVTAWANSWQTSLVCIEFLSIVVHVLKGMQAVWLSQSLNIFCMSLCTMRQELKWWSCLSIPWVKCSLVHMNQNGRPWRVSASKWNTMKQVPDFCCRMTGVSLKIQTEVFVSTSNQSFSLSTHLLNKESLGMPLWTNHLIFFLASNAVIYKHCHLYYNSTYPS